MSIWLQFCFSLYGTYMTENIFGEICQIFLIGTELVDTDVSDGKSSLIVATSST